MRPDLAREAGRDHLRGEIDCAKRCVIPAGVTMVRVTRPRHAWSDVFSCPHCGDTFLVLPADLAREAER